MTLLAIQVTVCGRAPTEALTARHDRIHTAAELVSITGTQAAVPTDADLGLPTICCQQATCTRQAAAQLLSWRTSKPGCRQHMSRCVRDATAGGDSGT